MSKSKRAKNWEDVLDLVLEAALAHREAHELLRGHGDTASIMAASRSLVSQGNMANLESDLRDCLVDLSDATFDQEHHDRVFDLSGLVLMNEPERRVGDLDRRDD